MRLRVMHIVLLLTALAMLAGCGRRGRVIPEKKMIRLYTEMFLADQWLRDHNELRQAADTTLFFDPIFRRHGYSFADFDRSVQFYLDRPEKYAKILNRAADRIRKEGSRVGKEADAERERRHVIEHFLSLYQRQDFTTDSLRWAGVKALWPALTEVRDTTAAADSLAAAGAAETEETATDVVMGNITHPETLDSWEEIKPVSREERTVPRRIRLEDKPQQ